LNESGESLQCWGHNKRSQHELSRPENIQPGVCRATPPLYICISRLRYVCICGGLVYELWAMSSAMIVANMLGIACVVEVTVTVQRQKFK
jgi:hypothetical protein